MSSIFSKNTNELNNLPAFFKSGCIGNNTFLKYCGDSKYWRFIAK